MHTQVVVVGAGPVGLMLASELRLGGADVLVLERLAEPTTESRASTLHARTMEILDERGLLAQLGAVPNERMGHFGGLPLDLGALATGYPGQWKVPQARVEDLLARRAGQLGAIIRREHSVVDVADEGDRVRVRVAGPTGPLEVSGDYLVGCDGEDSTVRALTGIPLHGSEASRELLRADVAGVNVPNRRFQRLGTGLAIASRGPNGVTRVMVCDFGHQPKERAGPPSFDEFCGVWRRVTGEDISHGTPIWINAFGDASRQAAQYRRGRVLLAGDAAHHQMPAGGQAINLGLQDAVNLAWKLAAAVSGRAPQALLDTYHDERHAVGGQVLANIRAQALLLLGGDEVDAARALLGELIGFAVVRDRLAGMISGLDIRYGNGGHPLVGARLSSVDLMPRSSRVSLVAPLRAGRGMLVDLRTDRARRARLRRAVARWPNRVDLVAAASTTRTATDLTNVDGLLVRPDGHVAWVSETGADPRPALRTWFGPPSTNAGPAQATYPT